MNSLRALSLVVLSGLVACSTRERVVVVENPRQVIIDVEVFDPDSGFVWEGVAVRVVEGFHEWSNATVPNPDPADWLFTDEFGRVLFTSHDLAEDRIGFREDEFGRAIIFPDLDEDEAFVLLELSAIGFDTKLVDVPVSWTEPDVFVSIPYSPVEP